MDADRFDALSRSLTSAGSRRRALTGLLSGALGLFGASVEETAAKKCKKIKNKKKRKKCLAKAKPCVPTCAGKLCGDDGCGGVCGVACASTHTCLKGRCVCPPSCAPSNACGPDGCGDSCGMCTGGRTCQGGQCTCPEAECNGACVATCAVDKMRNPSTCGCCMPNDAEDCVNDDDCCSGRCDPGPGSFDPYFCSGLPNATACEFNEQCRSGICERTCFEGNICDLEKKCQPA
jgi:hypothetical protein